MATPEIAQLTQALIRAAESTANAALRIEQIQSAAQGSSSSTQTAGAGRFSEASKVVKQPAVFGPDTPEDERAEFPDWSVQFKAWLFYADSEFEAMLLHVEENIATPVDVSGFSDENKERVAQLYSILTGILKGRPFRILRNVSDRNGLEVWRQLVSAFQPHTKSRAVSLLTALMNLPPFGKDRSLREQIQSLDLMRNEYRRAAGREVPDDVALATLTRVLPNHIRQHVQLQMTESSTYDQVRTSVLAYEQVTMTWSPNKVHSEFGVGSHASHGQHQGVAPMEIDRVGFNDNWNSGKGKGKGKNKGKHGKGKGGPSPPFKGKGKGPGKFNGKGKHQYQHQQQQQDRPRVDQNVCLYCNKPGHWKRDCRAFKRDQQNQQVRQVEQAPPGNASSSASTAPPPSSGAASNAGSTLTQPSSAAAYNMQQQQQRQIRLLPFAEERDEDFHAFHDEPYFADLTNLSASSSGNIFMMSSAESDFATVSHEIASPRLVYKSACPTFDMTYSDSDMDWMFADECEFTQADPQTHVRALTDPGQAISIILDSGADGSVLPLSYANIGRSDKSSAVGQPQYVDAQGNALGVHDTRVADIRFGDVVLRERFAVAPITSPLICLGRILQDGWSIKNESGSLCLVKGSNRIPLRYRNNSLCADGVIRMVSIQQEIRVITLQEPLKHLKPGWTDLGGDVYALLSHDPAFVDTTLAPFDLLAWYRTTLVCSSGVWDLIEFNQDTTLLDQMTAPFNLPQAVEQVITLGHVRPFTDESLQRFFVDMSDESKANAFQNPPAGQQAEAHAVPIAQPDADEQDQVVPLAQNEIEVAGVRLDSHSEPRLLRDACTNLGLPVWGNRKQLFERLVKHLRQHDLLAAHAARHQIADELERRPVVQAAPGQPTQREIDEHNTTHFPYRAWCEHCVLHKGRQDAHHHQDHERASHSVISFDFGYCSRRPDTSDKITVLFAHDRATGLVHAIPTPAKGGRCASYLCTELTRFILWTGHPKVAIKCDQEPATLSLMEAVRKACRLHGVATVPEPVAIGNHEGNGAVEQAVHGVRQQAGVFVSFLERQGGAPPGKIIFGCDHPIYAWSLPHAAWCYNRYRVVNGLTAYEACTDRQCSGKIATYAEMVYGFLKTAAKAGPQWRQGVWLGKTMQGDVHVIAVPSGDGCGIFTTRSVRRMPRPWSLDFVSNVESMPWDFGYAALGSKLILAKRILPPQAVPVELPIDFPFALQQQAPATPDEAAEDPPDTPVVADGAPTTPGLPARSGNDLQAGMMPPPPSAAVAGPASPRGPGPPVPANPASGSGGVSTPMDTDPQPATPALSADEAARRGLTAELDEGGSPRKQIRIQAVHDERNSVFIGIDEYFHEDESFQFCFDQHESEYLEDYDDDLRDGSEANEQADPDLTAAKEQLIFPDTGHGEPQLDAARLQELDALADKIEIERLIGLGVLLPPDDLLSNSQVPPKTLSTRFVRTWREKTVEGRKVHLRRSRYVAREFAWQEERQDLYSPASSNVTSRLFPTLFLMLRSQGFVLSALDVADAFLTVCQKQPALVTCEDATGGSRLYALGKVLPGQRDGSQLWHGDITAFLLNEFQIRPCPTYPSILRSDCGSCFILLHVDDMMILCKSEFLHGKLLPTLAKAYDFNIETLQEAGDEISFLKRKHLLTVEGNILMTPHVKHFDKLFSLLRLNLNLKPKPTPAHPMLQEVDKSEPLGPKDITLYRSCIGILMYLSGDLVECQFTIRALAQMMSSPTYLALQALRHLAQYLLGAVDNGILLTPPSAGFEDFPCDCTVDLFTDSDWAANKTTRRSVSSAAIILGGNLLYSSSRTQRTIALSSAEAELYSATSGLCDTILIRSCLQFMFDGAVHITLHVDNCACEQILRRSGVGRVRHLGCRILWTQALTQSKQVSVVHVNSQETPSDLGTKRLSRDRMELLMYMVGCFSISTGELIGTRHWEALQQQKNFRYCVNRLYSAMDSRGSKKPMQQMIKLFMISQMVSMTDALSTGDGDIEPNTTRPFASLQIHDFTDATPGFFLEYYLIFSLIFTTVMISVWTFSWLSKCIKSARRLMMFAWQIHHAEPDGVQHSGNVRNVQEQVSADKAVRRRSSAAAAATYWKATKFPLIEFLLRQHAQEELESCFVTRYGRFYHRLGCKWLQNHAATEILLTDLQQRHLARCRTCHSCTETNLPSSSGLTG